MIFFVRLSLLPLLLAFATPPAAQPLPAQRDVPYVPTRQVTVEAMLRIANVGPKDFLIDLGSGDGRIVITAARLHGTRGFGVDIDPARVKESLENAREAGVADRVSFLRQNLFETNLSKATVITMYLLPQINVKLRPKLLDLAPGTRIVSHDFDMGDWQPDLRSGVRGTGSEIYFWIVPARVGGRWRVQPSGRGEPAFELELNQRYQEIEAVMRGGRPASVMDTRLEGDRIQFIVVDSGDFAHRVRYEGRVHGNVMQGIAYGDGTAGRGEHKWRAVRTQP